ncbi:MAG: hypothetical protein ABSF32_00615 [Ignavibacteria bacterium]
MTGLIDPYSLVSLQQFIERRLGKKIPPHKITVSTFDTVRQIVKMMQC